MLAYLLFFWLLGCLLSSILLLRSTRWLKSRKYSDSSVSLDGRNETNRIIQVLQFILRLYLFLSSIIMTSVGGCWLSAAISGKNGYVNNSNYWTGQLFYTVCSQLIGIRCQFVSDDDLNAVVKKKFPQYSVIICNHQSSLDLLIMAFMWPHSTVVIAKESVKWIPWLGWHLWMAGNIFIRRQQRDSAVQSLRQAGESMKQHHNSVFLFPEGTRSHLDQSAMLSFKKGAFHLAVQVQCPIVPVVVSHYSHLYSFRKRRFNGGNIYISVLDPIDTSDYRDGDDIQPLIDRCYQLMLDELKRLDGFKI